MEHSTRSNFSSDSLKVYICLGKGDIQKVGLGSFFVRGRCKVLFATYT